MEERVTLYIATHNITGKKYFGKTICYFTKEDLQKKYHGGGIYWNRHLNKHGADVSMEIYQICSLNESDEDYVVPIALKFSEENNIVKSEEWANEKYENGLDGGSEGYKHSKESKSKMSESQLGSKKSDDTKEKLKQIANNRPLLICPHCGIEGASPQMKQWHFDNCKFLKQISS